MIYYSEVARDPRSTSLENAVCKLLCVLLRRTSLELYENWRDIYTTRECAQTKRHCVWRRKEDITMMEWEKWGYTHCCEEQCEAIQVRKEKVYRLSGTSKRQRSKGYRGNMKERKTVTASLQCELHHCSALPWHHMGNLSYTRRTCTVTSWDTWRTHWHTRSLVSSNTLKVYIFNCTPTRQSFTHKTRMGQSQSKVYSASM